MKRQEFVCVIFFLVQIHLLPISTEVILGTSEFARLLESDTFVDKTLLIPRVVADGVTVATAPRLYGKSAILDMLKTFFEVQVDQEGVHMTRLKGGAVTDTSNYELFIKNNLKITRNTEFMTEHFGKYPVLSLDFKCDRPIRSYNDALMVCKRVVQNCFKQHSYLLKSKKLNQEAKDFILDRSSYIKDDIDEYYTNMDLLVLSEHLKNHFYDRRVVVLIDNHDSIFRSAIGNVADEAELEKIVHVNIELMENLLSCNDHNLGYAFVTGVFPIPLIGYVTFHSYEIRRFLQNETYTEFFGFSENEVEQLMGNPALNVDSNMFNQVQSTYNGYIGVDGKRIYNFYSVLNFLNTGAIGNYWIDSKDVDKLREICSVPACKELVKKLLQGPVTLHDDRNLFPPPNKDRTRKHYFSFADIKLWQNMLLSPDSVEDWSQDGFFYYYLLEEGFLIQDVVVVTDLWSNVTLHIPNTEVTHAFNQLLA
ncbi:uncharacterized protein LOC128994352 [Macrosteles quadrilineatus]|uniref:uncharacterized protein LOC128994352 n=1 Tax=Macrosteles quadrilineatus TaxID=74068 RepID=UPI0023E24FB6|nr:uncharacterized protein LOC128994352 [Macrosteles quadrilineatus]